MSRFYNWPLSFRSSSRTFYAFLICHMRATCPSTPTSLICETKNANLVPTVETGLLNTQPNTSIYLNNSVNFLSN